MSDDALVTSVRRVFAGRPRTFELLIDEIAELERLCNAGVGAVFARLCTAQFKFDDIRETVRLGLRGGGMSEAAATALVRATMDRKPLAEYLQLAADILGALINGMPPEPKGAAVKKKDAPATSPTSTN